MNIPFDMKKLALITMKGHGLSIAFDNPKKAMSIRPASFEEASSNLDPAMVFPRRRKICSAFRKCVAHASENFWSFSQQTDLVVFLRYTYNSSHFHFTTVRLTSIGNPLIGGAYFSAFRRATTKLNSLYHPPLGQGCHKLLPVSTPWAGAKK